MEQSRIKHRNKFKRKKIVKKKISKTNRSQKLTLGQINRKLSILMMMRIFWDMQKAIKDFLALVVFKQTKLRQLVKY